MRLATLSLLFLAACAQTPPPSSPDDWAALADALSSEEYAETFVEELESRLDDAGADLSDSQREAVYDALVAGSERQRALLDARATMSEADLVTRLRAVDARTDAEVEAVLTPQQVPVYLALQTEARAALAREASRT